LLKPRQAIAFLPRIHRSYSSVSSLRMANCTRQCRFVGGTGGDVRRSWGSGSTDLTDDWRVPSSGSLRRELGEIWPLNKSPSSRHHRANAGTAMAWRWQNNG